MFYMIIGVIIALISIYFLANSDSLILGGGGLIVALYLIAKGREKAGFSIKE